MLADAVNVPGPIGAERFDHFRRDLPALRLEFHEHLLHLLNIVVHDHIGDGMVVANQLLLLVANRFVNQPIVRKERPLDELIESLTLVGRRANSPSQLRIFDVFQQIDGAVRCANLVHGVMDLIFPALVVESTQDRRRADTAELDRDDKAQDIPVVPLNERPGHRAGTTHRAASLHHLVCGAASGRSACDHQTDGGAVSKAPVLLPKTRWPADDAGYANGLPRAAQNLF